MRKRTPLGDKCTFLTLATCTSGFNTDPNISALRGKCRYSYCPSHNKEQYFAKTVYNTSKVNLTDNKEGSMKRVISNKVPTTFFKDADKSKVYLTILDGREAVLVAYDSYHEDYTSVTLAAHATRKISTDTFESGVELTHLLDGYIKTGYDVYEFDGLVEALKYITDNI